MKPLKPSLLVAGIAALSILFSIGGATAQDGEAVTLRTVTSFSSNSDWEKGFWLFKDKVEELSEGNIKLEYIGGPEAVPAFEQIEAVGGGIVDLTTNAGSYFSGAIPEVEALKLSELTPWEERENGTYDKLREIMAEKGRVYYLGRYHQPGVHFNFYTQEKVESTADFEGMKLRIAPLYRPFALALGIVPVIMPHSEIYTALERGMVEGLGAGSVGVYQQGHHEFVNYVVEPSFYGNDQVIMVNLDVWNSLSQEHQDTLIEAAKQTERESAELIRKQTAEERRLLEEAGVEAITLSDADKYTELAREAGWNDIIEKSPEHGEELRALMTK